MKPFVQKLPPGENSSFVARTYRTPFFETSWHQHPEYELILFTEGRGLSFIGNYVGNFETGDIFLLGSNLPHTFQKQHDDLIASAIVIQFHGNFWGDQFLEIPENQGIKKLLDDSAMGLKIKKNLNQKLKKLIHEMEQVTGLRRVLNLCESLLLIESQDGVRKLSTHPTGIANGKGTDRIDKIIQYTIDAYESKISLAHMAQLINMSVPAFCKYFKRTTKKTYVSFLNEVRVGNACKLLINSDLSILEICYKSGFGTLANFNKQFLQFKNQTPSQYRKYFKNKEMEIL